MRICIWYIHICIHMKYIYIYIYIHTHIYIYTYGTFSFVGVYREICEGPPFSLTPQLEVVRGIAFWFGLAGPLTSELVCCSLRPWYCCICTVHAVVAHVCSCLVSDMSAFSHSRHDCCVTPQTRLLCHTVDMYAVSHG